MSERLVEATKITSKHELLAFGAGVVPFPLLDIAAITVIQLRMLSILSEHYDVKFSENRVKSILGALLGGFVPTSLACGSVGSLIKSVPVVGAVAGALTMPVFAAASTRAVGRVFTQHFESGGTFLDCDLSAMREEVKEEVSKSTNKGRAGSKSATA